MDHCGNASRVPKSNCYTKIAASRNAVKQHHKFGRSEEHTSELQSPDHLVCRLLLEKKKELSCFRRRRHPRSRSPAGRCWRSTPGERQRRRELEHMSAALRQVDHLLTASVVLLRCDW